MVVLAEAGADDLHGTWPPHTFWLPWVDEGIHISYGDFVARVVAIAKGYRLARIASETNGAGAMPTDELHRRLRFHHGTVVPVTTTSTTKQDGFGAIKVLMSQGRLALPRHPGLSASSPRWSSRSSTPARSESTFPSGPDTTTWRWP